MKKILFLVLLAAPLSAQTVPQTDLRVFSANPINMNAIDGDPTTVWISTTSPLEIVINLGTIYDVNGLKYLPRQNSNAGRTKLYEVYVSVDPLTWGEPAMKGDLIPGFTEQIITWEIPKRGQYVKFRALEEQSGREMVAIAELGFLGALAGPPVVGPKDKLAWNMAAPSLGEVNGYDFWFYRDGNLMDWGWISGLVCTGPNGGLYVCVGDFPDFPTPGFHSFVMNATESGGKNEGPISEVFQFQFATIPPAPVRLKVIP